MCQDRAMNEIQTGTVRPSRHAIDRYRERVEAVEPTEAGRRLVDLASDATRRSRPRHWTLIEVTPGTTLAYPHAAPDLCLVIIEDTIVTVITRRLCRASRASRSESMPQARQRRPYRRPSPGSIAVEIA